MTSTQSRTRSQVDRAVDLARAEKASGEIFGRDWWDMTRYLGGLTGNSLEIGKVFAAVAPILSTDPTKPVSRRYLSQRRALAQKIASDVYRTRLYYKLPPRVTLEWSSVSGADAVLDRETAKKLIEFEAEGRSLREIYDLLPGREKPKSWQSASERAEDEQRIVQEALSKPENIRKVIQTNPDVRRAIVEDIPTRAAIYQMHNEVAKETTKDMDLSFADDKKNQTLQTADIATKISRMRELLREVRKLLIDHAPDPITRSTYAGSLAQLASDANELVGKLRDDAEFEAMMARSGLT